MTKKQKAEMILTVKNAKRAQKEKLQEAWREKHIYPLEKLFNQSKVFFTINVLAMDDILNGFSERTGELVGNFSTRDRMGHFISPGASKAYGAMLNDPFPW